MEIAVSNKKFAEYNIVKDRGSRILQLIYISPSSFQTAVFNGEHIAISLEHTAVNLYCGTTHRGQVRFISYTAVSKDIIAVIMENRVQPRYPLHFFSVGGPKNFISYSHNKKYSI